MQRLLKTILSVSLLAIFLVGCDSVQLWHSTNDQFDSNKKNIQTQNKAVDTPPPPVTSKHQAYVDTTPVSLARAGDWYNAPVTINGAQLPFSFYMTQLLGNTPVNVHTDPGVNTAKPVTIRYSGSVKGALQELSAKSNYYYDYDIKNNTITWSALETRTFDVSFIPGTSKYSVGNSAGGGGSIAGGGSSGSSSSGSSSSGSSSAQYTGMDITQTGEYSNMMGDNISVWDDVKSTIETLLSPRGRLSVSQATTTVTVRDHPSNISDIQHYLDKMNKILSKQVHFDVEVLDVTLNKQFQYGIDWTKVQYYIGSNGGTVSFAANFANASGGILDSKNNAAAANYLGGTSSKWNTTNVTIKALEEQGKVSIVTQPSVTTLNDQVAQIAIQTQQSYLASQTNSISGVSSISQQSLDPGIVTYGLQMYILPKIEDDKVFLQISSTLSDLLSINTISQNGPTGHPAASASAIQVPILSEKNFNQRSVLKNGQTLVLAGFKSLHNNNQKDTVAGLTPLGGLAAQSVTEELVVLITPTILTGDNF